MTEYVKDNRRKHTRYDVRISAIVRLKRKRDLMIPATILNLSVSGAMLETDQPVAGLGEELVVELHLGEEITFRGRVIIHDDIELHISDNDTEDSVVRWTNGQGQLGIEFTQLTPEKQAALERLVAYFEAQDKSLRPETPDLWKK